jgi:hypothetical protein
MMAGNNRLTCFQTISFMGNSGERKKLAIIYTVGKKNDDDDDFKLNMHYHL